MKPSYVIPSEVMDELLKESLERRCLAMSRLVDEQAALFFPGLEAAACPALEVVGTFDHHLIVGAADQSGRFFRAFLEDVDGKCAVVRVEPLELPVYRTDNVAPLMKARLSSAAEGILSNDAGLTTEALGDLLSLLDMAPNRPTLKDAQSIARSWATLPWESKVASVRTESVEASPKWAYLYTDKLKQAEDTCDDCQDLDAVVADADAVMQRMTNVALEATQVYKRCVESRPKATTIPTQRLHLAYDELCEQVLASAKEIVEDVSRFRDAAGCSPCLGLVVDAARRQLPNFNKATVMLRELAGTYAGL